MYCFNYDLFFQLTTLSDTTVIRLLYVSFGNYFSLLNMFVPCHSQGLRILVPSGHINSAHDLTRSAWSC